jgi:hypothetical protein
MKAPSNSVTGHAPEVPDGVSRPKLSASDKRKAQNRAAQRTYRLKRIARLKELEDLAASAGLLDDSKIRQTESVESDAKRLDLKPSGTLVVAAQSSSGSTTPEKTIQTSTVQLCKEHFDYGFDTSWPPVLETEPTVALQSYSTTATPTSQHVVPIMLSWERDTFQTQPCTTSLSSGSEYNYLHPLSSNENYYADPYANNLRLHAMSFLMACQINGQVIGIPDILNYCDEELISPFYNPEAPSKPQILDSALSQYRDMKRDLRPNVLQITTSHHP